MKQPHHKFDEFGPVNTIQKCKNRLTWPFFSVLEQPMLEFRTSADILSIELISKILTAKKMKEPGLQW